MTPRAIFKGSRIIPLGGVGEFGANATIVQTPQTTILVDFGIMFPPDRRQPGVDYYINDPDLLLTQFPELSAVFVTHGHEDHIGGLPFLLAQRDLPLFTMPYTARLIRNACSWFDLDPQIVEVALNVPVTHGDLRVEFIGVTHSIIQACALLIETPDGRILHSGDFKVDPLPEDGYPFQSQRLAEIGDEGLDLLIMDSTNALNSGFCPGDYEILPSIEEAVAAAPGRVFFTTFSSHMPRIKKLKAIARATGRKIALVGKSLHKHFQAGLETGYLEFWADTFVDLNQAKNLPDNEILYVVTGSQAEGQSVMVRIAGRGYQGLKIEAGDLVIFSSKAIPGNERKIALLVSDLNRRGAEAVTQKTDRVHTSGHGFREDLAYLLALSRPKYVAPIHGEFLQLIHHHRWLQSLVSEEQQVLLAEDGDCLRLEAGKVGLDGSVQTAMLPIDGNQDLPLTPEILRDRKNMMYSGLILVTAMTDPASASFQTVEVATHGVAEPEEGGLRRSLEAALGNLRLEPGRTDGETARQMLRCIKSTLNRNFFGRPLIKIAIDGKIVE